MYDLSCTSSYATSIRLSYISAYRTYRYTCEIKHLFVWLTFRSTIPQIYHKSRKEYQPKGLLRHMLTHWGRVTHICVSNLTIIGSDNGLSPGRRQAISEPIGILLIGPLETISSEISIEIHIISFKRMHLKISSGEWRPFCLGLNMLTHWGVNQTANYLADRVRAECSRW